jgi:isohexenylglutaconyl-CoA hydratase
MTQPAMSRQTLSVERKGPVLKIVLNRPEARNALSPVMVCELTELFQLAHDEAAIRAVVLSGAGGTFCAGGDLKGMERTDGESAGARRPSGASNRRFGALLELADALPKAVIALIEGAAMGGGVGLIAIADWAFLRSGHRSARRRSRWACCPRR